MERCSTKQFSTNTERNRNEQTKNIAALSASALLPNTTAPARTAPPDHQPRLTESKVYQFADLPTIDRPHGQVDRTVLNGLLATGEPLEVHETTLPPGQMPHSSHRHLHSELTLVRSGLLECDNDGHKVISLPGGIFFVGSNAVRRQVHRQDPSQL